MVYLGVTNLNILLLLLKKFDRKNNSYSKIKLQNILVFDRNVLFIIRNMALIIDSNFDDIF